MRLVVASRVSRRNESPEQGPKRKEDETSRDRILCASPGGSGRCRGLEVEGANLADQQPQFLAQMGEGLAADFDLLDLVVIPGLGESGKAGPDREEQAGILHGSGGGCGGDFVLEGALGLAKLREEDGVRGDLPEIAGEAQFVEGPDGPLGGIELPRLYAVAVIVLKLVVIIVIALAEGDQSHDPAIPGAAPAGVRPRAERVAGGIDAEGAMLETHHARHAADQETAQGADRPLIEPAHGGGKGEADEDGEEMDVAMLKADEPRRTPC